jgi:hypothetical protein
MNFKAIGRIHYKGYGLGCLLDISLVLLLLRLMFLVPNNAVTLPNDRIVDAVAVVVADCTVRSTVPVPVADRITTVTNRIAGNNSPFELMTKETRHVKHVLFREWEACLTKEASLKSISTDKQYDTVTNNKQYDEQYDTVTNKQYNCKQYDWYTVTNKQYDYHDLPHYFDDFDHYNTTNTDTATNQFNLDDQPTKKASTSDPGSSVCYIPAIVNDQTIQRASNSNLAVLASSKVASFKSESILRSTT